MASILVVDDYLDGCEMLVRLISRYSGPAECAESGEEALQILRSQDPPKLVFLDWMMPGMSGLEVLRAMRSDPALSTVPVVVFSALADLHVKRLAVDAGAQDFIAKGDFEKVEEAVKKYVKYAA